MQEAAKDAIQIILMGPPRIRKQPKPTPGQEQLNGDAEALEMIALLLLSKLATVRDGSEVNLHERQFFEREWLVTTLYPGTAADERRSAQDRMRHRLRRVNAALATKIANPGLERMRGEFGLELAHLSIDVHEILIAARQFHTETNQDIIIARGARRLLEGMAYPWLALPVFQELRRRLDDCYLDALCRKADGLLFRMESATARGNFDQANGYRNQALPLLDQAVVRLRALDPAHPLGPQVSHLLARTSHALPRDAVAKTARKALSVAPTRNIPRRITTFVGRETEKARLQSLMIANRIVTIIGMGGCGKTRLALETAAEYEDDARGEAWLVELAGVADPAAVPQALAQVLRLPEPKQKSITDALMDRFRTARALLVLDNCEHVLAGVAPLAETLAQACPNLTILATSRQPLNIDGECLVRLEPLRVPSTDPAAFRTDDPVATLLEYESARLFVDRIRRHNDFSLSRAHVAAIASICASLDGIPLALELAAARAAALSLEEISDLLTDRFNLLATGRATALGRHKTLRAVIDWSYDLLTEREQALLCRLSVFAGGWTRYTVGPVGAAGDINAADVFSLLTNLIDKSLVIADPAVSPTRYRMLETVRQYASDRLQERGEFSETRGRHRAVFLAIAEGAEPHLRGPEPGGWLDRLESETDNLQAALAWRADEQALRIACALQRFWLVRSSFQEGRRWLERAWEAPETLPSGLKAQALAGGGSLAALQGNLPEANDLCGRSLILATSSGDAVRIADALYACGMVAMLSGEYGAAVARLQECLETALAFGHERSIAEAQSGLARVAHLQGKHETAREFYAAALALCRSLGDALKLAEQLMFMGLFETDQGQYEEAHALLNESLAYQTRWRNTHKIAQLSLALCNLARIQGRYAESRLHGEQSLAQMRSLGDNLAVASLLNMLAMTAYEQEDFQAAERGFEQARAMMLVLGNQRAAVAFLINTANAAGKQGKYEYAATLFRESIVQAHTFGEWLWIGASLEELGLLEANHRPRATAVTLLIAADSLQGQEAYHWTAPEQARIDQALSDLRAALGDDVFTLASDAGRAMTKEQAVAYALETR